MPVYEFRNSCTGEVREEIYVSWRDAPQSFPEETAPCVWERIPSRLASAIVMNEQRVALREKAKRGIVPFERGMDRDMNEARIRREKADEADRHRIIRESIAAAG